MEKEKEAVRQLEQYKTQSEEQYKQMKIKVREEVDSRIKLEEDLKRLQKEIAQLGITVWVSSFSCNNNSTVNIPVLPHHLLHFASSYMYLL